MRRRWLVALIVIIALGLLSRTIHTGSIIIDKYPGDALYAAMVYAVVRLFRQGPSVAVLAMSIMTVVELFQLTLIPAHLLESGNVFVRICARLMGTEFSFLDLIAYAVGIGCLWLAERICKTL